MSKIRRLRALAVIAIPFALAGWQAVYIPTSGQGRVLLVLILLWIGAALILRLSRVADAEEERL